MMLKNIGSPTPLCIIAPELSTLGKVCIIPQIIKPADITANIFHRPCLSFLIFAPQYSQNAELLSISCLQLGHFIIFCVSCIKIIIIVLNEQKNRNRDNCSPWMLHKSHIREDPTRYLMSKE